MDLLLEVEELGWLEQYVDADNFRRTCLYLTSTSAYLPEPDDKAVLYTAFSIYIKVCFAHFCSDWRTAAHGRNFARSRLLVLILSISAVQHVCVEGEPHLLQLGLKAAVLEGTAEAHVLHGDVRPQLLASRCQRFHLPCSGESMARCFDHGPQAGRHRACGGGGSQVRGVSGC